MGRMNIETLKAIAALVKTLPCSAYPRVDIGSHAVQAVTDLRALGGEARSHLYDPPKVIEAASLNVDGVTFSATYAREPTADERERIAREACVIGPEIRGGGQFS